MSQLSVSPTDLYQLAEKNPDLHLIDVRTPIEFRAEHVRFARNLPLDELDPDSLPDSLPQDGRPWYVVCQSGSRSRQACEKLRAAGCTNVVAVDGGVAAWKQAGLPIVRGKQFVSLERQVRIAAGTLVVLAAAFGYFLHPLWIGLAAIVGAGLVFAGVTDTCGMAMLLAKMPWNQVADGSAPRNCNSGGLSCES